MLRVLFLAVLLSLAPASAWSQVLFPGSGGSRGGGGSSLDGTIFFITGLIEQ